jgi:hypothetical protein
MAASGRKSRGKGLTELKFPAGFGKAEKEGN